MLKNKNIIISGVIIWLFAIIGTALVSFTQEQTREQIIENERQALLRSLFELIPADRFDNDLLNDTIIIHPSELLGNDHQKPAYRARKNNQPIAIIFNATAPNGYNGDIDLLIGINTDGSITGVRAVKHKETPGLGDPIDIKKSNWITQFNLKSLTNPIEFFWSVNKDGGEFDQLTGATITSRAVVDKVKDTLNYYQQHKDILFLEARHEQQ